MKPAAKRILVIALCGAVALLIAVMPGLFPPRGGQECAAVNVIVSDFDEYQFVTQKEVEEILKNFGDYPLGKRFDEINMTAIEQEVEKHPMVRRAVCYQTPSGGINVEVTQRIPVFRVMSSAENYYVDDRRETMPVTVRSSAYVPVVSGNVNKEFAVGELYDFVVYLQSDDFLESLVEQIYVRQDGGVELVPRVGDCVIYVGSLERYPAKMDKLKVFYGKVPQRMGWDTYSRINLEYVDQVVCTRR